jgi:hypothetical protein
MTWENACAANCAESSHDGFSCAREKLEVAHEPWVAPSLLTFPKTRIWNRNFLFIAEEKIEFLASTRWKVQTLEIKLDSSESHHVLWQEQKDTRVKSVWKVLETETPFSFSFEANNFRNTWKAREKSFSTQQTMLILSKYALWVES